MRDIFSHYWVCILAGRIVECGILFIPFIGFPYWQEGLLNAGYFYPFNMFPYWQEGLLNVGYFLIRSIGLPYMQEGLLNAGYRDTCFRSRGGGSPSAGDG